MSTTHAAAQTATTRRASTTVRLIATDALRPDPFSLSLYGDPTSETDGLLESIRERGILVPLVVSRAEDGLGWEVLSGHRRLTCARALGLEEVPCQVRHLPPRPQRRIAVLDYNRQRTKTFSQRMREADALEALLADAASQRRMANLRRGSAPGRMAIGDIGDGATPTPNTDGRDSDARALSTDAPYGSMLPDSRDSDARGLSLAGPPGSESPSGRNSDSRIPDPTTAPALDHPAIGDRALGHPTFGDRAFSDRPGRTDATIARAIGLGGKDLYRQARAVWKAAAAGDPRAQAAVSGLDAGTKTIHAAYKDLRRRDRFAAGFRPTPYDVWAFKHDRAFGVPHPGAIPAGIVAHAVHYFTPPGGLVVDPMAGGGTTLDVCASMGRRCLAYDLHPVRPEIRQRDVRSGLPPETAGCDLIFCDPPYHTMLARRYPGTAPGHGGIGEEPLTGWIAFLQFLSRIAFLQLRPGGHIALLLANQTEKDLPAGYGYIDHAFLGYGALLAAGFLPVRRISCPMDGAYRPQDVRRARADGRLLGQVRDLIVMRKPLNDNLFGHRLATGELVDPAPDERVRQGGIAPDDRPGE